jgi:hypothetical protein
MQMGEKQEQPDIATMSIQKRRSVQCESDDYVALGWKRQVRSCSHLKWKLKIGEGEQPEGSLGFVVIDE